MENFSDLMNNLPNAVDIEKARGMHALVQFSIAGEGGGQWAVTVDDGRVSVQKGSHPKPELILKADAKDAASLMTGKLNPMTAFMTGKIKLVGDMGLAMKLLGLLK
jgi:putative sterol carrier protein